MSQRTPLDITGQVNIDGSLPVVLGGFAAVYRTMWKLLPVSKTSTFILTLRKKVIYSYYVPQGGRQSVEIPQWPEGRRKMAGNHEKGEYIVSLYVKKQVIDIFIALNTGNRRYVGNITSKHRSVLWFRIRYR